MIARTSRETSRVFTSGFSPSCRCGEPGFAHVRGVCRNCYALHQHHEWGGEDKKRLYHSNPDSREKTLQKNARWERRHGYKVKNKDRIYMRNVRKKYGLSNVDYEALLQIQGGRCAICWTHNSRLAEGERLQVDHSHATGEVRGLLCAGCNKMLGYHEKRGTNAWSNYTAFPPMRELQYRRDTPEDEQVHPY